MSQPAPIAIVPNVRGLGGPASFHARLAAGLGTRGIPVTYDLDLRPLSAVLVIGGTRELPRLARLKADGIPIVQRLNGMNWVHRRRFQSLRHSFFSEVNNWILAFIRGHLASRIVYQSHFSADWWQRVRGGTAAPHTILYNGVDLSEFHPAGDPKGAPGPLRVVSVEGRIQNGSELGLRNAVNTLDRLARLLDRPVRLTVAGDVPPAIRGPMESGLKLELEWAGVLEKQAVARLEREVDLFFSAEINPACPNAVIEALASGLPVAGFENGAVGELVDAGCGLLAPYGTDIWQLQEADAAPLAQMLAGRLADLPRLGKGARAQAEERFSLDRMVEGYLEVLLGGGRG